ncbi:MAG: redox-sensing transcriptional repressor Rex [Oscillospiraceae bacterium]|nr:redox-sensing transcriptional repressor Rex [Oscillospiraceae bacterium]
MKKATVSVRTVERLPKYLAYLNDMKEKGHHRVSSASIAEALGATSSQVRQDIATFGNYGSTGYGYEINRLSNEIKEILDLNTTHEVAIIGVGSLGHALLEHLDFNKYGFHVFAGFDVNPDLIGTEINGVPIYATSELGKILTDNFVDICILTLSQKAAKPVAKQLYDLGVPAIWNFTNVFLDLPKNIFVRDIDFLGDLFVLSYQLSTQTDRKKQSVKVQNE